MLETQLISIKTRVDPRWLGKVEKWCKRCTQKTPEEDSVIIMEGRERSGKTTASVYTAGLSKEIMGRPIHMFFKLEQLIEFAKRTDKKIIIWDEPALSSLTGDQMNAINRDLKRLLMTCGVKRHLIIINFINFTKFEEYLVVERPHGFVHFYKGRPGHACYIRYNKLEKLRAIWLRQHRRAYNEVKSHYLDFPSMRPEEYQEYFDSLDITINNKPHCTYADYDRMKNEAIASIGEKEDKTKDKRELRLLKYLVATEPKGLSPQARAIHYKVDIRSMQRWKYMVKEDNENLSLMEDLEIGDDDAINDTMGETERGPRNRVEPPNLYK